MDRCDPAPMRVTSSGQIGREVMRMREYELWEYRGTITADVTSIDGFDVEATDGSIGHVDEATYEAASSYVVVDTGPWIFGRKVVVPGGAIDRIDLDARKVFVALSKGQIKASPAHDADRYRTDAYRAEVGTYYGQHLRR